ncbi:diguanylate cyclase [Arcobacter sp. s6]|uniref:diguanylate cyclase domain-containing protein n=1 Tax=Arcobacter sp. s6 TaxID=3230363 RepID=UPI00349FDD16
MILSGLILPIICKKYNISCILFSEDFKIVEFTDNLIDFVNDSKEITVNSDIRDFFWEFVGLEDKLKDLNINNKDYLHIPMLSKRDIFYDVNIELCYLETNKVFYIAMFTKQSKLTMDYVQAIQLTNQENLYNEYQKEDTKNNEIYYNLINQKLISFHIDDKGIITEVNEACISFFGLNQSDMIGSHFSKYFFSREIKVSSTQVGSVLRARDLNGVDIFFHTDIIPMKLTYNNMPDNIIICQDITYLKKIQSELEYSVNHDSLTGLPNRTMLMSKIENAIFESKNSEDFFALCFIDLNKFKKVNDEHGHHVGDMLLKHIGEVISDIIRDEDTIARLGGDEFVILFEHLKSLEYLNLTLKRIEEISKKSPLYYNKDLTIPLSFSLGVSIYPKDGDNIEDLLNHADEKMYEDKKIRV